MPIAGWRGALGRAYTDRSPFVGAGIDAIYLRDFGISRSALNRLFLGNVDRSATILECGANTGGQLRLLSAMGFSRLYAIDVQFYPIMQRPPPWDSHYAQASILALPFPDGAFDLVFTSRVLIHIRPDDLPRALSEIYRVSRRYLWGFEYYAHTLQEIPWHGQRQALWKGDYAGMLLERFDLRKRRLIMVGYKNNGNLDCMYLLEKGKAR